MDAVRILCKETGQPEICLKLTLKLFQYIFTDHPEVVGLYNETAITSQIVFENLDWIQIFQDGNHRRGFVSTVMNRPVP
jgi:hypothetical protein